MLIATQKLHGLRKTPPRLHILTRQQSQLFYWKKTFQTSNHVLPEFGGVVLWQPFPQCKRGIHPLLNIYYYFKEETIELRPNATRMKTKLLQYCNARARSLQGGLSPHSYCLSAPFSILSYSLHSTLFSRLSLSLLPSQNTGKHGGSPPETLGNPWSTQHFLQETLRLEFKNKGKRGKPPETLGNPWETQHFIQETLGNPNNTAHIHPLAIYKG